MSKKSFSFLLLKYILYNRNFKFNLLYKVFTKDYNQENISFYFFEFFFKKKLYYSKIRIRCHFSFKSRAVLTKFMLNRIPFKELASFGYIQGVKKAN